MMNNISSSKMRNFNVTCLLKDQNEIDIFKKYFQNIFMIEDISYLDENIDILFIDEENDLNCIKSIKQKFDIEIVVLSNNLEINKVKNAYNKGASRVVSKIDNNKNYTFLKDILKDLKTLIKEIEVKKEDLQKKEKNIARNEKRVNNIISHSDKLEAKLRNLNAELDEYKNHLEEKVKLATTEIIELNKELEETQKEVVFTMGAIGESRSKETGNHVKRVAEYSYILAKHYGLDEIEAQMLKEASPMHDIGKVAIADMILNKPARFTPEEFEIMKTHARLGFDMLKHSNRPLLKMAAIVANEHHEKYDGNGYPRGLSGEDIHIYGRITAVADVFDALGSDRCYKKAWDDEKIFSLFKEERGKHFDPKLIDIFFEHLDEFLDIREKFKDSF